MTVFGDRDRIGPSDGDVLFAGHWNWVPVRPPYRLMAPGALLCSFTVAGRGVYECAGITLVARRGDLVIAHRDSPIRHSVPAGEPWEYFFVRFDPPRGWTLPPEFDQRAPGLYRAQVGLESTHQRVQDAFVRIIADLGRRTMARALDGMPQPIGLAAPSSTDDIQRRLLLTIVDEIFLLAMQDPADRVRVDARVAVALEAMGIDPAGPHTVESLAKATTLSPSRFAHLFTSQVGMSPMRTLRLIRLQHAARLLRYTGDPVGTIAIASGFTSIFDFSRQFRKQHGVSPRQYRTKWQR